MSIHALEESSTGIKNTKTPDRKPKKGPEKLEELLGEITAANMQNIIWAWKMMFKKGSADKIGQKVDVSVEGDKIIDHNKEILVPESKEE